MSKVLKDLQDVNKFTPAEKFHEQTKFALIIGNEVYDKEAISFQSLPKVKDDIRNAQQTVK